MAKTVRKSKMKIDNVKVRMYCLGTGDCFVLKFCSGATEKFTMMIDCGSCSGGPEEFKPYLLHLGDFVKDGIDLLVVTHEHNDHVNGFSKCPEIFEDINLSIRDAWFAWTENPKDPGGRAKDLIEKRRRMKMAFANALTTIKEKGKNLDQMAKDDYHQMDIVESHNAFVNGLETLQEINLPATGVGGDPLPGMLKIKEILRNKKIKPQYLEPGETVTLPNLPGMKFYVLGPPYEKDSIFKNGKEGRDVYKKKLFLNDTSLSANAFINLGDKGYEENDLPFSQEYILDDADKSFISTLTTSNEMFTTEGESVINTYNNPREAWRTIEMDWLSSAGSLALRLNSHINNTSLVLAIEAEDAPHRVLLLPGDAEYGSWESWHLIKKWDKKSRDGKKHLVEDLLNRTVFYKVGHHLSYNGTALEKGINMMEDNNLVAMATLDRNRISKKWKSTMPNKHLMEDLIKRCKGKVFIMDESDITNGPSKTLDRKSLSKTAFKSEVFPGTETPIYIQYTVKL